MLLVRNARHSVNQIHNGMEIWEAVFVILDIIPMELIVFSWYSIEIVL